MLETDQFGLQTPKILVKKRPLDSNKWTTPILNKDHGWFVTILGNCLSCQSVFGGSTILDMIITLQMDFYYMVLKLKPLFVWYILQVYYEFLIDFSSDFSVVWFWITADLFGWIKTISPLKLYHIFWLVNGFFFFF